MRKRHDATPAPDSPTRAEMEQLAELGREIEAALAVEAPPATQEKALFVAGAAAAKRAPRFGAALVPATAAVVLLVVLAFVSRGAQPGDVLFTVRGALSRVGLAPSATKELRADLERIESLIEEAGLFTATDPERAQDLARRAFGALEQAENVADELDRERNGFDERIDALEDRADDVYDDAEDALDDADDANDADDSGPGSAGDDSSGPGSGPRDSDDDSSGPGSGDSDDDNSGPGSGSDDDSSGPGSGDDDSSGSGSGADSSGSGSGSGDDSSGPGSGDSDDDNSGPGSGDDD